MPRSRDTSVERVVGRLEQQLLADRKREIMGELHAQRCAEINRRSYLRRAQEIVAGRYEARIPPTEWGFIAKLRDRLAKKGEKPYSDEEASDWRSFIAWHEGVSGDVIQLVDVLGYFTWPAPECDGKPRATLPRELALKLAAKVNEIKDQYRRWAEGYRDEQGNHPAKIEWLPRHFYSHRLRDPRRRSITAIEFLQGAVLAFDDVADRLV